MKYIVVVALLLCIAQYTSAVYYDATADQKARDAYFKGVSVTYSALNTLLTKTHVRTYSYDTARKTYLYPLVDVWPDGLLRGVYTHLEFAAPTLNGTKKVAAVEYNCEHAVPQSWFGEGSPMKADLHHLFTAEMRCNSFRNNYPYGAYSKFVRAMDGCGDMTDSVPLSFEPVNGKGAVARATLYFLVRYPGYITAARFPLTGLDQIIQWAAEEPVELWEKHRNYEIFQIQGNRNPFIDYPSWANSVNFKSGYAS